MEEWNKVLQNKNVAQENAKEMLNLATEILENTAKEFKEFFSKYCSAVRYVTSSVSEREVLAVLSPGVTKRPRFERKKKE